jgi:hypothetical protein
MRHRIAATFVMLTLVLLVVPVTLAQESSKASCRLSRFRGATAPGGATVDATVVNNGKPCPIKMHSDVDAQMPTTELHAVEEPQHGKLEFPAPDVAHYTPSPGYTGADQYAFAGSGPTAKGTTARVRVTVRVTVVNP